MAATSFHFRAITPDGKVRTGSLTAETQKLVASELRKQGLTPVYVGLAPKQGFRFELPKWGGARRKNVLFFTQELSTLLNAGIPLDRALQITSELTEQSQFRTVVMDVLRTLKGGKTLADSLATHPDYFSELYVNMVRAGEASGSLATIFERLAEFERTRDDLRNYIIGSMVYPGLLSAVGLASITILMYFVVPRFASVFESGHLKMPLPTKIMIEVSNALRAYGWIAAAAIVAALSAFQAYIRTVKGRLWWDSTRLKLPLLGDALRKAETSRFARAMATLIANSVPLVQAISISRAILTNRRIANSLEIVSTGVKRGEGIAVPLRRTGQFPPLAAHLLTVGEETGKLDAMFLRMADIYETETRNSIKRFTSLFEPLIILIMGILVGALILSMLVAITSINEVAG
ncbi:MAG: type II secretion system F family protein [Bryobacterales bacterium]|nr:type II secretion system F family protein [Bryobacterales bacterium]